jgi:hypothetical protein
MEYKNQNMFALQGDSETSDMDVCETLGLDPALAGTSAINEAAIKAMHRKNYDGYINNGMPPEDALNQADKRASDARAKLKSLLKR